MVQFDSLKFRRTFKKYFSQFVWIEKKSQVKLRLIHESPTKNSTENNEKLLEPRKQPFEK